MPRKLRIEEMDRLSIEEFKQADKSPLVIILDNIRSLHNVGSIFRTADAFCLEAVYLCGITGIPPHREIHKTALGASDSVDWKYFENSIDAVNYLKEKNYTIVCLEQAEGSTKLNDFEAQKDKRYALVLGNEVKGVDQKVIDACHECLEIPQYGTKHSLNVSISGGIAIWAILAKLEQEIEQVDRS